MASDIMEPQKYMICGLKMQLSHQNKSITKALQALPIHHGPHQMNSII